VPANKPLIPAMKDLSAILKGGSFTVQNTEHFEIGKRMGRAAQNHDSSHCKT
jgi:hypothetical protein